MRIDQLTVKNFKGFESKEFLFHPQFNLVVGKNGKGKTSVLEALSVAAGSWFLGVRGFDTRHIRPSEVRLEQRGQESKWESIFPCEVAAKGWVQGEELSWCRTLNSLESRTTYVQATKLKKLAQKVDQQVRDGEDIALPLISYYGTARLCKEPRESYSASDPMKIADKSQMSRFSGYYNSVDPRLSVAQLTQWLAHQSWITFQKKGRPPLAFSAVERALVGCIEGAEELVFDADLGEVVVHFDQGRQPFSNLSDGHRCMLAMVGDIAQKAAKLNPQFGSNVLEQTEGIVLIDELDLHLHPSWQRHVIDDLRRTFPKIQFVCTTHSPFLIQSLRSSEELICLDGEVTADLGHLSLQDIAQSIQDIDRPEVSARYADMKAAAKTYFQLLEEAHSQPQEKLEAYKARLAEGIGPYSDNPAFQAFLELKRVAMLGS